MYEGKKWKLAPHPNGHPDLVSENLTTYTTDHLTQKRSVQILLLLNSEACRLGVKVRNMKMDFNIYGTWRQVTFEKLMMKIYDFFYSAKSFSHPV